MKVIAPAFLVIASLAVFSRMAESVPPNPRAEELGPPRVRDGFFPALQFQPVGPASCASMACHNNQAAGGLSGSEYTIWVDKDAHAKTYQVLFSKRSRYIQANLERSEHVDKVHPEKNALCLRCHVHPDAGTSLLPIASSAEGSDVASGFFADGVSCEVCHGPAEKWLSEHYRPSWKVKSANEKEAWGMYDTKSIPGRARLCVDCHVGSPSTDANHDLLAAGHPRLNFEFAAFHAKMPRHWSDDKDKDPAVDPRGRPDFEARAWAIGQALTATAALNLLAARAAGTKLPWPELAEYDCYACHHGLQSPSPRQPRSGRLPGSLPWESWYTCMTPHLPRAPDHDSQQLDKLLKAIRREMEKPAPSRQSVADNAQKAARILRPWPAKLNQPVPVRGRFWELVRSDGAGAIQDWDHAVQMFNALGALHNAWADMEPHASPERAYARRRLLDFGRILPAVPPYESPKGFDTNLVQGPLEKLRSAAPR